MRVLLIEDDPNDMELASRELRRNGLSVLTADGGEQGLAIARSEHPDLILCDVNLVGMHGYEFAKACKEDSELRLIPLVAITGATVGEENGALAAGFDDLLFKPLNPETLGDAAGRLLDHERRSNLLFRMAISRRVGALELGQQALKQGQQDQGLQIDGLRRYEEETRHVFVKEVQNVHADNQQKWTVVGSMLEKVQKGQYVHLALVMLAIVLAAASIIFGK